MRKMLVVTIVAAFVVSLSGCCNGWPRSWWYRGDACEVGPTCGSWPGVTEQMMMPPTSSPEVLPGPANTEPST